MCAISWPWFVVQGLSSKYIGLGLSLNGWKHFLNGPWRELLRVWQMLKKVHCSSDSIKLKIFASRDVLSISLIRAMFGKIEFQGNDNEMVRKVIWSLLYWNLRYLQMSKQFQNWLVLALELGEWHWAYPRKEASDWRGLCSKPLLLSLDLGLAPET